MVEFIAALLLFPFTAFLTVILWFTSKQNPCKVFPPGNRCVPLIGETLSFFKPHPANSMGGFMEDHISRYGKIFSSNLLGRDAIVSADAELNRFVQNKDVRLFSSPLLPTFRGIFGGESLAFAAGETHKRLRSTYFDFLSMKRLKTTFSEDANHLASGIVRSWRDGAIISAKEESTKYSLKIIAKSTLSIEDDCRIELLLRDYSHVISALCSVPINFPGMKYWKALKSRRNVLEIVKKIMEERITFMSKDGEGRSENCHNVEGREDDYDLLDLLLMKRTEYSEEAIHDFIFGSLFAGHDSTSRAIAFMLYLLADSPEVVTRLQEEHLQIVKSKSKLELKLSWDDYRNMEFTKSVINETLRLSNVAPFIPKKAIEDVKYKGIVIPRGDLVIVHIRALHLDPSIYDDPMQFNPWRWMEPNCIKSKKAFMPFGGGARMCPGENLAKLEMAIFLHHIILSYELEIADHQDHPMCLPYVEYPKGLPIRLHASQIFK
ncbi:Cytochrome P450 90B1 [Dendrobium catenatum]|uniref:Cytochrome P450 90B1 n=1 Tax=Dendrobium catenatum TaxID=906689 RepID=A0A2I0X9S5_9ASPA|nr:Cytochrome P450 90B1 [Dendrobium catenatum]